MARFLHQDTSPKVETGAHTIVIRYGLWGVVDYQRAPAFLADSIQCQHTTPVELYGRTDSVSTRTEYDDRTMVVLEISILTFYNSLFLS